MNDEQILLDDLNAFEDFMENADVEEIKKEHGLSSNDVGLEVVQGEIVESAEQVHNRICDNFAIVEKTLYEICVDLKSIRDNKHYKTLGYNTFEDYCLENFNIKRRQAYNYISIAENLSSDFVHSGAQFGVKKLYCLSRLTDEERTELVQTTDIEKTTVKELEQKSKEIKENREVQVKENDVVSNVIEPKQIKENTKKDTSKSAKTTKVFEYCIETYYKLLNFVGEDFSERLGLRKSESVTLTLNLNQQIKLASLFSEFQMLVMRMNDIDAFNYTLECFFKDFYLTLKDKEKEKESN